MNKIEHIIFLTMLFEHCPDEAISATSWVIHLSWKSNGAQMRIPVFFVLVCASVFFSVLALRGD